MRLRIIILFGLLFVAGVAGADETLPTLKVGGVVYTNVTVTSVTAKNIYFMHNQGMGNAKLKDLDPALQKHFHYDGAKEAAEQKQAAAAATALSGIGADNRIPDNADPKVVMDAATEQVKAIVNQPVTPVALTRDMENIGSGADWFHPGAIKPDFDTVDVRKTQETSNYDKYNYVTSGLNPGVAFPAREIAFNSMTKYFYVDRSVPKKKLTEAEMLEINRLYRIIGQCERKLNIPKDSEPQAEAAANYFSEHRSMLIGIAGGVIALLLLVRLAKKSA
jgi:hypothetical protein